MIQNMDSETNEILTAIDIIQKFTKRLNNETNYENITCDEKKLINICCSLNKFKTILNNSSISHRTHKPEKKYSNMCYMCKEPFTNSLNSYQNHNTHICIECDDINYQRRNVKYDLTGKIALVTGGRIKIGFYTALNLLRNNCKVIITSRFAENALERYQKEEDFDKWKHNLDIYQVNFCRLREVYNFIRDVKSTYPKLDFLINNAAQTIRRPMEFYENLRGSNSCVKTNIKRIYGDYFENYTELERSIDYKNLKHSYLNDNPSTIGSKNCIQSLSLGILTNRTMGLTNRMIELNKIYFPKGKTDEHGQQLDMRNTNSWVKNLHEIDIVECVEVQVVNSLVPFILNSELKQLLVNENDEYSWIINVSSMEGKFNQKNKTSFHPHTNMAKAGLNMMTRTCGSDYINDRIVMVSVDTGWNTVEQPCSYHIKSPLDCIDGAARILDPIFRKLTKHGVIYKDFMVTTF